MLLGTQFTQTNALGILGPTATAMTIDPDPITAEALPCLGDRCLRCLHRALSRARRQSIQQVTQHMRTHTLKNISTIYNR